MINNIRFKIIDGKINKIPEFYMIFARKMPDFTLRQQDRGQAEANFRGRGRGESFDAEAEAEAKSLRPRPRPKFWARNHFSLEDLTMNRTTVTSRALTEPCMFCSFACLACDL